MNYIQVSALVDWRYLQTQITIVDHYRYNIRWALTDSKFGLFWNFSISFNFILHKTSVATFITLLHPSNAQCVGVSSTVVTVIVYITSILLPLKCEVINFPVAWIVKVVCALVAADWQLGCWTILGGSTKEEKDLLMRHHVVWKWSVVKLVYSFSIMQAPEHVIPLNNTVYTYKLAVAKNETAA